MYELKIFGEYMGLESGNGIGKIPQIFMMSDGGGANNKGGTTLSKQGEAAVLIVDAAASINSANDPTKTPLSPKQREAAIAAYQANPDGFLNSVERAQRNLSDTED